MIAIYNGTSWVRVDLGSDPGELLISMDDLVDVNAVGIANGQALIYDLPSKTYKPGDVKSARYTHNQSTMAAVWTVTHNLNCHPQVSAEDAAGSVMYGTVRYTSNSALTITFNTTITGRANCW